MNFDTRVKLAVYRAFADRGAAPAATDLAATLATTIPELAAAYARLAYQRLLVLDPDGLTIRMAPPFSGVPTQHRVHVAGIDYHANCAWDALGIVAALHAEGEVRSRCEQSMEPLALHVGTDGPGPSTWLFHCAVPAAEWWRDIVFT